MVKVHVSVIMVTVPVRLVGPELHVNMHNVSIMEYMSVTGS